MDINPLSDTWFAKIFFRSVGFFILLIASLVYVKAFEFNVESHLLIFLFVLFVSCPKIIAKTSIDELEVLWCLVLFLSF